MYVYAEGVATIHFSFNSINSVFVRIQQFAFYSDISQRIHASKFILSVEIFAYDNFTLNLFFVRLYNLIIFWSKHKTDILTF